MHLQAAVQRVEQEQVHVKEQMRSNYDSLNKGQELLLSEFRSLQTLITANASDPKDTPAGRVLLIEIDHIKKEYENLANKYDMHHARFASMQGDINRGKGVLAFLSWIGFAGILAIVGVVIRAALKP